MPGGRVEWGERLSEAVVREVLEETGLHVHPREILLVVDHLDGDPVQSHLVIVDYRCDYVGGTLRSGSDAEGAVWAAPDEFDRYDVPAPVREVIGRAIEGLPRPVPGGTLLK